MNKHAIWEQSIQWLSRTLAVVLFMLLPGALGGWLDRQLGTSFLMPVGFAVGVITGIAALLVLGRQFTPPARGKPLPWDEPENDQEQPDDAPPPTPRNLPRD